MTIRHDLPRETPPGVPRAEAILAVVALAAAAVVAGGTFTIWRGYDPSALTPAAFVEMHQGAVRGLNTLLPAVGLFAILSTALLLVRARERPTRRALLATAAIAFVVAGLVTRFGNQPINAIVMTWSPDAVPDGWEALRGKWWSYHVVRTAASCLGFLCLAVGTQTR
jgi:hypothetical protein